jgi:acyl carrier protein
MTPDAIQKRVVAILARAVPGAEVDALESGRDLRDQLDMDSLDVLNFATALSQDFGIAVPEVDYDRLMTLDGATAYLAAAVAERAPRGPS